MNELVAELQKYNVTMTVSSDLILNGMVCKFTKGDKQYGYVISEEHIDGSRIGLEDTLIYWLHKFLRMTGEESVRGVKLIGQVMDENPYANVMSVRDFARYVEGGLLTSYDGHGYLHDGEKETDVAVLFSPAWLEDMEEKYPYVCWYNK